MGQEHRSIEWQAAQWVDRMGRAVLDSETAADFDRWILADPRHVESYARLSALWQARGLEVALDDASPVPLASNDDEALEPAPSAWRRIGGRLLAAGGALCLALVAALTLSQHLIQDSTFTTQRGETHEVALSDGTTIRMDGDTQITVRITPWSRQVVLARGEAFFDVAHERLRGFSVDAGDAGVSVLGTAFDIDRVDADTRIIQVYRGLVSVDAGAGRRWRLPAGSGLELSGERVRSLKGVAGERPGWTDGWYEANDTPLSQLVHRLNRGSARPVTMDDPALGELLVTGRFQTGDPRQVLEAVAAIHDLHWREAVDHYVLER